MCILIQQPAGNSFSDEWLKDFYRSNSDGIGIMFSEDNAIHINKILPKDENELISFYRENADGKECLIHFRMKTHGDIDLDNCHPYPVFTQEDGYPLWLMHNGILHTGNSADISKSDTWHYINDIIKPALKADPTQFMAPWFQTLIEEHIGSTNKFAMLDAYGNFQIFNKDSGVMWGDVWMSNTYAWSASKAGVTKTYKGGYVGYGRYGSWDNYEDWEPVGRTPATPLVKIAPPAVLSAEERMYADARDYVALFKSEVRAAGLQWILNQLADVEIEEFYIKEGEASAYDLLDVIADRGYTGRDILDLFDDLAYGDAVASATFELSSAQDDDEVVEDRRLKVGMM